MASKTLTEAEACVSAEAASPKATFPWGGAATVWPTPCFACHAPVTGPKPFRPRTVPRILSGALRRLEDHLSVAAHSAPRPKAMDGLSVAQFWPCFRRGLPCRAGRPARGALLPHLFTLTPCGVVYSLWRYPAAGDIAPASRPMPRTYYAARFEPAPCPVKFGSSSPPLREERPSIRGLNYPEFRLRNSLLQRVGRLKSIALDAAWALP